MAAILDMTTRSGVLLVFSFNDAQQRFSLSLICPKLRKRVFFVPATMDEFGKTVSTNSTNWHTPDIIYIRYYETVEESQIIEAIRMAPATNFFSPFEYFACVFNDMRFSFDADNCHASAKRALARRNNKENILFEIYFSNDDEPVEYKYTQGSSNSAQWTDALFKDLKKSSLYAKKTGGYMKRGMTKVLSKL